MRGDSTIADLHYTLQIAMGWDDFHLHQFIIRGKRYGIGRVGGLSFTDNPYHVHLNDFRFRPKERFVYEYDFSDRWQHEIRVEKELPLDLEKTYPVCTGGGGAAPLEDCGGAWAFMALKQRYSVRYIAERMIEVIEQGDFDECPEELHLCQYWLTADKFDRRALNRRLRQYAAGDDAWH